MVGRCFVCDLAADANALVIERKDGTTYPVPFCVRCYDESILPLAEPPSTAHELIDVRNDFRLAELA